jgi:hypothetical protein
LLKIDPRGSALNHACILSGPGDERIVSASAGIRHTALLAET